MEVSASSSSLKDKEIRLNSNNSKDGNNFTKTTTTTTLSNKFKPVFIITIWLILSTAVILYNRTIMIEKGFSYPITLTTIHLLIQTIATRLLARFTNLIFIHEKSTNSSYDLLPLNESGSVASNLGGEDRDAAVGKDEMTWKVWREQMVPPAAMFSVSLVLSNWVYLYLGTGYISMLKSLSPVAILLAAFIFRTKEFSFKLLSIVLIISFGVGLTSYGEKHFNLIGFLLQFTAIIVEATRVTLIQILLVDKEMSPLKTLYYFAPICLFINFSLILPIEGLPPFRALPSLGLFTILSNGLLTFGLNLSTVYLISLSTLILSLSKVLKDILLVLGSCLVYGENVTIVQGIGFGIATAGMLWYKTSPS